MRRIVHVISTPSGIGGAERILAAIVAAGEAEGWDHTVLNPFTTDPDASALAELFRSTGYVGRRCASVRELPSTLAWLRRAIVDLRPDIVHAHLVHAILGVAVVAPRSKSLVLTHHHGDSLVAQGRPAEAALDRWAGHRYRRAVAVSGWVERYLVDEAGYAPERVVCIPNGWDGQPADRSGLALVPTIVCVANFRPGKGHDTLLRAFAVVRERIPMAELRLIGDGELRPTMEALAETLGVADSVRFLGYVPDTWPVLAEAHVFALASEYETLGLAVLEAMAAGLPVVAADIRGMDDLVRPGVTGVLVPTGDHLGLARALADVLAAGPDRRCAMGRAARASAAGRTMQTTLDGYYRLYADLAKGPDATAGSRRGARGRHRPRPG